MLKHVEHRRSKFMPFAHPMSIQIAEIILENFNVVSVMFLLSGLLPGFASYSIRGLSTFFNIAL